ncbi:hypothetical protein Psuf_005990 [Phytohabitans suffuscus]|uniref:Uncharacterized protein n=1 Tax=Phytohabitans suffuscus TaxID=624315 RepID=A0A6F8YB16_9ACTN|nr:hypothetical protein Psuf_005990 [Phytohabitans suffuscus]
MLGAVRHRRRHELELRRPARRPGRGRAAGRRGPAGGTGRVRRTTDRRRADRAGLALPTPSSSATGRRPAVRTTAPAAPRTTAAPAAAAPKAPVALGPEGGPVGLWQMLREYCERTYRTNEAQLRHGTGQAENNWECRRRGEDPLIDMNAACRGRYGSAAFAQFSNRDDAFSWHCFRR